MTVKGGNQAGHAMIHKFNSLPSLTINLQKKFLLLFSHVYFRLEGCKKSINKINLWEGMSAWAMIHKDFPRDSLSDGRRRWRRAACLLIDFRKIESLSGFSKLDGGKDIIWCCRLALFDNPKDIKILQTFFPILVGENLFSSREQ